MKKYPDYIPIADMAMGIVPAKSLSGEKKSIIGVEEERSKTNHCKVGYLVAKSWRLSNSIINAIFYYPYVHLNIHKDTATKVLVALLLLSEFVCMYHDSFAKGSHKNVEDWVNCHEEVKVHLDLDIQEVADIQNDVMEFLG
ncbi:MAG: HDOD domain-containing protein [Nitrospirae bacterium]|nr:HDOD domain-containing protein [Nitrospirota bacterium]